jgi:hypothetical protein
MWRSDGTPEGTRMVHDVVPGPSSSRPQQFTVSGDHLFFVANGNVAGEGANFELWAMALNEPPVAVCQDVTVEADAECEADADVDGGSFDPDSNPITVDSSPPGPYGIGMTTVTLTVTDDSGESDSCEAIVTVVDVTPPEISVAVAPEMLWPPNRQMADIQAMVAATDACGVPAVTLDSITHDEAGGDSTVDIQGADLGTADLDFQLRAKRDGHGDGRVYTIIYTATDSSANSASASAFVYVPHDRRARVRPGAIRQGEENAGVGDFSDGTDTDSGLRGRRDPVGRSD